MPGKPGILRANDKQKLQKNYSVILEDLDAMSVLDFCVDEEILTIKEVIEIADDELTPRDRNKLLWDHIYASAEEVFDVFLSILENNGFKGLSKQIRDTDTSTVAPTEDGALANSFQGLGIGSSSTSDSNSESSATIMLNNLTEAQKGHIFKSSNLKEILPLTKAFGFGYENFIIHLGFLPITIQQIKLQTPHSPISSWMREILEKWIRREGRKATLEVLLKALEDAENLSEITIEYEHVQTMINKINFQQ